MSADSIVADYASIRPQYEAFTASMDLLLRSLLQSSGIEFFAIETRTKENSSFAEKVEREDKVGKYKSVADVTDLTGLRVIAYLEEDCLSICSIIEKYFDVDKENSVRKEAELDPDKFGYLSTHFVITLPEERTNLLEFSRFAGMKAEIQVRTLLQHTWAAIDWKFRYKEEREAPKEIRRRLFRISALLEAADNEFSAVKEAITELHSRYAEKISKHNLDIPIDTESLKSYLASSASAKYLVDAARSSGIRVLLTAGSTVVLGKLATTVKLLGIKTIEELDEKLSSLQLDGQGLFEYIVENGVSPNRDGSFQLFPAAVVRYALIAFASKRDMARILREVPVSKGYKEPIEKFADASRK